MGLEHNSTRVLVWARQHGVSFEKTCMIGRQSMGMDAQTLKDILSEAGLDSSDANIRRLFEEQKGFAEPLLQMLGAKQIDSVDASSYEQATIIHDMNQPLPDRYFQRYTLVLDSGSLEHIFNFPQAVRNCMEMVQVGGHFVGITPANNFMGHGFYQFSPELFYRVFAPANGFEIERLGVYEIYPGARWHVAKDPAKTGMRSQHSSVFPTYMFICARRSAAVPVFATTPQQSDYATMWRENDAPDAELQRKLRGESPGKRLMRRLIPRRLVNVYQAVRTANAPYDPKMFERM